MSRSAILVLSMIVVTPISWAHDDAKNSTAQSVVGANQQVASGASEAVDALDRFSSALSSSNLDVVAAYLDPDVLILESGGAERTREEYLGGHAKHDAEFLKNARITLKQRKAGVSGDLVWVGSESEIHAEKDSKLLIIHSTESAVLRKTVHGWKIVHLHWSSKVAR